MLSLSFSFSEMAWKHQASMPWRLLWGSRDRDVNMRFLDGQSYYQFLHSQSSLLSLKYHDPCLHESVPRLGPTSVPARADSSARLLSCLLQWYDVAWSLLPVSYPLSRVGYDGSVISFKQRPSVARSWFLSTWVCLAWRLPSFSSSQANSVSIYPPLQFSRKQSSVTSLGLVNSNQIMIA